MQNENIIGSSRPCGNFSDQSCEEEEGKEHCTVVVRGGKYFCKTLGIACNWQYHRASFRRNGNIHNLNAF